MPRSIVRPGRWCCWAGRSRSGSPGAEASAAIHVAERELERVEDLARTERLFEKSERRRAAGAGQRLGVGDGGEEDRLHVEALAHQQRDLDPVHRPGKLDI